ncbi:MAG: AtpZ/AtpI family protein [Ignavibacteriaceae bacterium]|nr:AtpZ/AtpI family protein [Ignavibacteriaceae bacterium]
MMIEDKNSKNSSSNPFKDYAPYLGLGVQLAASIVILLFIGIWLDGKFDSSPYLTLVFSFLGIFTGMYHFIKSVTRLDK